MFFIASTGRTGTLALVRGLDLFSDHQVAHEPVPLLREAWLKHRGMPYYNPRVAGRLASYAHRYSVREKYGESVRTANLLPELLEAAPGARLLVIVRDPVGYVRSAYRRRVLRKGDDWDLYRLMPTDDGPEESITRRLAYHWCVVNRYLLDVVANYRQGSVVFHQPLAPVVDKWARLLGVTLRDREGLAAFLNERHNRSWQQHELKDLDLSQVEPLCRDIWEEARAVMSAAP